MPATSHLLRVAIFTSVLAAVGFGVTLAVPAIPASAALQKFYVDDDRNVVDDGAPCVAHAVNYGACYKSISSAINDLDSVAGEVDEIWVDDGSYNETVFINKPVKLVSINGPSTTVISQSNSSHVVRIEADAVTFGGPGAAAGEGFTVLQQGAAPGYVLGIDGSVVAGGTVTIQNNVFMGTDSLYGIFVGNGIEGGNLVIRDNELSGFTRAALQIESVTQNGDLTVNDNSVTGANALYGIYVASGIKYGSTGEISRNNISGITADSIYVYQNAFGAHTTICNNTIAGGNEGIVLDYPGADSSYEVCYNTIKDFTFDAIFTGLGPMEHVSMNLVGNIIDSDAAEWGIYVEEVEGGAVMNAENNNIHLRGGLGGIYLYGPEEGSTARIHNNVLDIPETDAGIDVKQTAVSEGSSLTVTQNEIRGYDQDGLFVQNGSADSTVLVQDNIFEGAGTTSGINFPAPISGGSIVNILNNCISNSGTGIITGDLLDDSSEMHINQNHLAGQAIAIDGLAATKLVDGESNWYGSPSGPNGANADVVGNVDADPWLNSAPSCSGTVTPTGPVGGFVDVVSAGGGRSSSTRLSVMALLVVLIAFTTVNGSGLYALLRRRL